MTRQPQHLKAIWITSTLAAGIIYVGTASPGLLWGDSGDAQLRVFLGHLYDRLHLSRSHILYYLITGAISEFGVSASYSATLVSAVCGAITVGNISLLSALLISGRVGRLCAAALLLFSHSLWHLATVAEVMTLSTMLLSFELVLVTMFIRTRTHRWIIAAMFVNGLGLATHSMALLMWPAYVAMMLSFRRSGRPIPSRTVGVGLLATAIGALPLIALYLHLCAELGHPLDLFVNMLVGRYAPQVFNMEHALHLIARMIAYTAYCFPTPVILLALVGIGVLWRRQPRPLTLFLLFAFGACGAFAIRYDVADQHVFMLHSHLFLSILAGIGADHICARWRSTALGALLVAISCTGLAAYMFVPELLRRNPDLSPVPERHIPYRDNLAWFLQPWHHGDEGPERFARETLNALPRNVVLMVDSTPAPPLLYLQNRDSLRRDVRILGAHVYQPWFESAIDIASAERDVIVAEGRLLVLTRDPAYWNFYLRGEGYQAEPLGDVFRIVHRR